jgi:hypothetical protein
LRRFRLLCISGQCLIKKEGAWYNCIDDCNDLLAVKNTRATSIPLETTTTTTMITTTRLIDLKSSQQPAKKKRKISDLQTSETQQQILETAMSHIGDDDMRVISSSTVLHCSQHQQPTSILMPKEVYLN